MPPPSRIFYSYRALGFVSNGTPLVVRYIVRKRENLILCSIGKTFLTYGVNQMRLLSISETLDDDITCLAADTFSIFTACGTKIYKWNKNSIVKEFVGHEKPVYLLLPFAGHLIAVDRDGILKIWDKNSAEVYLEIPFSNDSFEITTIVHPATYINKILLGSSQGTLQLWNIKQGKLVHSFKGWNSAITAMTQAPAIDVVAVGLENGLIVIHNIKFDEQIMKFLQEWGPVTSLSFRTDGEPILASGSTIGHIAFWNLEEKKLQNQIRTAHYAGIAGLAFLQDEPLLITNSSDNSIKLWIFDMIDGGGRLLRLREGHSAPPTKLQFYGTDGRSILSAGEDSTLRSFSTVNDLLHKSLGRASFNRKKTRKTGLKEDVCMMPPITQFAMEPTRENEWDNVVACHSGDVDFATTWSMSKHRMGSLRLGRDERKANFEKISRSAIPTCISISVCGNFAVIGYDIGLVRKYNLQSGLLRGQFSEKAHSGRVSGVAIDALNQVVATVGMDKKIRFWKFATTELIHEITNSAVGAMCKLHRESGLLAVALDDFTIQLLDLDTYRVVRLFEGFTNSVTSLDFSNDSRWIIGAGADCSIRTWDIPAGRMIDAFLVEDICTSLTLSPTGEYLATSHVDNLGVYLWVNRTLYMHVSLSPLPVDFKPLLMPLASCVANAGQTEDVQVSSLEVGEEEFKSALQISDELVTLSLLPDSRWKNLLSLDLIRQRNKPKEPPKAPKAAPFFLPTIPGLEFKFADDKEPPKPEGESRMLSSSDFKIRTPFSSRLEKAKDENEFGVCLNILKEMGPSAIDLELHSLGPDARGSLELLINFVKMIDCTLKTNNNFEASQAYLGLFLKIHGMTIASEPLLLDAVKCLMDIQTKTWERLENRFNTCQSVLSYLKNAIL